jgi:hypothetical protein
MAENRSYVKGGIMLSPGIEGGVHSLHGLLIHVLAEVFPRMRLGGRLIPRSLSGTKSRKLGLTAKLVDEFLSASDHLPQTFQNVANPVHILHSEKESRYDYESIFDLIGRHSQKQLFETHAVSFSDDDVFDPEQHQVVSDAIEASLLSLMAPEMK